MKRTSRKKNDSLTHLIKRWPWGCLLFFWIACQQPAATPLPVTSYTDSICPLLKNGDLIFRNGTDEVSRAARSFNRIDTTYSHCGIVLIENDTAFVYHALGGDYNPGQRLKRDLLTHFCDDPEIDKFAVYRYPLGQYEQDSLIKIVQGYYRTGLKFDLYFNFLTDDQMYCSEFVFKALNRSLSGKLDSAIHARKWPYGVSPDDLFLHPESQLVKRIDKQ